jgi:DNA replication protein DnaC
MSENIDFGARQFDELIDFRYRENKSTCLTTNLMFELVKNKYPRVYDRLKEKNQFLIITGESQRISNWR